MEETAGLKEFEVENPWLQSLLTGMLSNLIREPRVINTKLDNLSNNEALVIGRAFASVLNGKCTRRCSATR